MLRKSGKFGLRLVQIKLGKVLINVYVLLINGSDSLSTCSDGI